MPDDSDNKVRRRMQGALLVVLLALVAGLPGRAGAQSARVDFVSPTSAGGVTQQGSFTLLSSLGAAVEGATTLRGTMSLHSGVLYTTAPRAVLAVEHTPPAPPALQSPVTIEASVTPFDAAERVRLFYRRGGDAALTAVDMTAMADRFAATLPASAVTSRGLAYHFVVTDEAGRTRRVPQIGRYSLRVAVAEPGLVAGQTIAGGTEQSAYRLISVPLDLNDKRPLVVLGDDLGDYDNARWRFFELTSGETLVEYPAAADMQPGKAFWLITREGGRELDTGAGLTTDLSAPYRIGLRPGWNLVGTPFNFDVPVERVRMASGQSFLLRAFEGSWNDPITAPVTTMRPFQGYAVFNNLQLVDTLLVDPIGADGAVPAGKQGEDVLAAPSLQPDWFIRIAAQTRGARDDDNIAAVAPGAQPDWDGFDQPEPPVVGGYVSVYFPHPEWERPTSKFSLDARPASASGECWDFEVRTNLDEPVRLRFDGVDAVPAGMEVWLVDELLQQAQDLRITDTYTLAVADPEVPRRLRLVVGPAPFVEAQAGPAQATPETFTLLANFPNPFQASTTLRYSLPEARVVTLRVFDVLGKEVAVLVREAWHEAGFHAQVWDGRSGFGERLPSGLYFLQLETGDQVVTRPVVLAK